MQEAKKLAEELCKEETVSQWVGLPPKKLLQESFLEQLDALQALDKLAPLTAVIISLLISYTVLWRIVQTDITQRSYRHLHIL